MSERASKRNRKNFKKELVNDVMQKFQQLKAIRQPYEQVWTEIRDFIVPNMGMKPDEQKGKKYGEKMFDGTGSSAAKICANGLLGYITTPSGRWFRLGFEHPQLRESETGTEWLQEGEDVYSHLFGKSNFYAGMKQEFLTGVTYGTATLWVGDNPKKNNIKFSCRSIWEIYIDADEEGYIDTVFREYKQTARNIVRKWGDSVTEEFKRAAKDKPYAEHKIIHAVFPREDRDYFKIDKLNKAYASIYILVDGDHLLGEGGFDSMPYIVWRYEVMPGETYGRSPGWDALFDIKVSNGIAKTMLKAAHRAVDPPVNAPQEKKGMIDLTPNGMNYYTDPNRRIIPIDTGGNYPIGVDMWKIIQEAIRNHFNVNFFLMWNQINGTKDPNRTATEVVARQGEQAAILSAMVSQIDSELLNPLFDRVFTISNNNGWFPEPPEELIQYEGAEIKVDYIGPLAQTIKKHWSSQQIRQGLINYISLFQVYPELKHRIDPREIGRFLLEADGFPEKLIVDDAIYDQAVEAEGQAQAQAMANQNGLAQAQVYEKLAKAAAPNSPAEEMF